MPKVTMQSIANQLGVSKVTVSKALNRQAGVGDELREKILRIAENEGYLVREKAVVDRIKKVGIIIPKKYFFDNENFYTRIYYFLLQNSQKKHIELVLSVLGTHDERNLMLPYNLEKDVETLLICGEVSDAYFNFLSSLPLRKIGVDFYKLNMNVDCVIVDNFYASYRLTSHMISLGHTRIGFVGNRRVTSSVADRYFGYLKALTLNGLELNPLWCIENKSMDGTDIDFELPDELPDAFVCHCDDAALRVIRKLKRKGMRIPEDVSVASFDNTQDAISADPPLTTMEIKKEDIAKHVMDLMFWRALNPTAPPRRLFVETKLIERSTVQNLGTVGP